MAGPAGNVVASRDNATGGGYCPRRPLHDTSDDQHRPFGAKSAGDRVPGVKRRPRPEHPQAAERGRRPVSRTA